jgi:hypothetical protein
MKDAIVLQMCNEAWVGVLRGAIASKIKVSDEGTRERAAVLLQKISKNRCVNVLLKVRYLTQSFGPPPRPLLAHIKSVTARL